MTLPLANQAMWYDPIYQRTALTVLSILLISGIIVFIFRQTNYYFISSWASIKSWLIAAPILFLLFGLPSPWQYVILTLIAIAGAKVFFQIMGMFHRSYFVLICYAGIVGLGVCTYYNRLDVYNQLPMFVLGVSCLVPIVRNNYKRMIQYISITLLSFIFLGWSFLHLGLILNLPNGLYQMLYIIVLTEFCDNTNIALSRYFGKMKLAPRINPKRTVGSTLVSIILTLGLAVLMRFLLPDQNDRYWLASGLVASLGGIIGDLVMTVIRKDAGVKIVGHFILGRGDFLQRMDRLIFVAPIFYYVMKWIENA
ncbi:MAG: phosphatidate cytidylyltransferase [Pseudobdellovibrionaceae bacterium]